MKKISFLILFLSFLLFIPSSNSDENRIDEIFASIQSARSLIYNGSITFERLEVIPPRPDFEAWETLDKETLEYLKGPIQLKALCTYQFKTSNNQILWKLTKKNTFDLSGIPPKVVERLGLDYEEETFFDGKASKGGSLPKYALDKVSVSYGINGMDDIFEEPGIPEIFKGGNLKAYKNHPGGEFKIHQPEEEIINVEFWANGNLMQSSTFSLSLNGFCQEQKFFEITVVGNVLTRKTWAKSQLRHHKSYSDFKNRSGVWFPMTMIEEVYKVGDHKREFVMKFYRQTAIYVIDCEFNIPLDNALFSPPE